MIITVADQSPVFTDRKMHIDIDEHAHLHSPLHRMDTRFKIVSLLYAALLISSCRSVPASGIAAVYALLLTLMSGISPFFYLKKTYYPLVFLVPLFLFLPLSSGGNEIYSIGCISIYAEGIIISISISLKVIAILILVNLILSTASFRDIAAALKALRVHDKMLNIVLFSYRYFFVFFEDLRKMRVALTLRGFKSRTTMRSLRSSASLAGSILVRSYEQTERIYRAMLLRGYNGTIVTDRTFSAGAGDVFLFILITAVPLLILAAELRGLFS